jgi:radical SAM superfamily enzyme YgiQ (UPF0313 family)
MTKTGIRVLLIYPPSRTQSHSTCPMGPLMIGAVLEQAGHEVHVVDANAIDRRRTSEEILALARELRPNVIGMTLLTPLAREAYRLAAMLRGLGAKLLAGGPHATLVPEEPLAHGFDAVALGEGEPIADRAVRALLGAVPIAEVSGLVYRDPDGAIRRTPPCPAPTDLDALPFPARHLADPAQYDPPDRVAVLFSSRGCTARCTYCAGGLFGRRFRFRSAENVLAEIRELHARYGTRHFHFCDDTMSMDRPRMLRICAGIRELGLNLTWSMMTRIDAMDEELLQRAKESGCTLIDYGVESGTPATLRKIRKSHTLEMVRRIVPLTRAVGIEPNVFFILGFPWEDVAAIEETRALMEELAPHVRTFHPALGSVLVPFPGTEIYDAYKDSCGFAEWWLGEERNFDVPRIGSHAYYEYVAYRCGAILDADFFRYREEVRRKIASVFQFMYFQNLRSRGLLSRTVQKAAFLLSIHLANRSPRLERIVFRPLARAAEAMRLRQQARDRVAVRTPAPPATPSPRVGADTAAA